MPANRFYDPFLQKFNATTGAVGAGWKLYFYVGGSSTTLQDTYSDTGLSVPNTNPVVADSAGLFGDIFLDSGLSYAVKLTDENDVQIDYASYIQQASANAVNITYDPAGEGAVATNVQAKLREIERLNVSSVAEGFAGLSGDEGLLYYAQSWHTVSDNYPPIGGGNFVYRTGLAKSLHNGGTIISPTVPSVSNQAGANLSAQVANYLNGVGETDSGGIGVFVREFSESHVDVTWFGAKGDQLHGGFDSWASFDAAYRSCFYSLIEGGTLTTVFSKTINIPKFTAKESLGYYLGQAVKDVTTGAPLGSWTTANAAIARIEWAGDNYAGPFGRVKIFKIGTDYAFRMTASQNTFRNLDIRGQGTATPATNTTERYPAILCNYACNFYNVSVINCGGPNYSTAETHVSVQNGRVGYMLSSGNTTPTCFAIGLITDNSVNGTNGQPTDCNTCIFENIFFQNIYGDGLFYSVSENGGSDCNASEINIKDSSNVTGAIVCINGGWMNKVTINEAILSETAVRLQVYNPAGGAQCIDNAIHIAYNGDGIDRLLYLDDRRDATNHDDSMVRNYIRTQANFTDVRILDVVSGANSRTLSENGGELISSLDGTGIACPIKFGFGAAEHLGQTQQSYDGTAGNLSISLKGIVQDSSILSDDFFHKCTYEVIAKQNNGDGSIDNFAQYFISWFGNAEGTNAPVINIPGGSSRTITLDTTDATDPKIVFSSASATNLAGVIMTFKGSYFWGT